MDYFWDDEDEHDDNVLGRMDGDSADGGETQEGVEQQQHPRQSSSPPLPQFSLLDEISGSCGDFGTLLPLLVAMTRNKTIFLSPTLFWSGITHILTGWYFHIPMPLQPMKAISSLAIAGELTQQQVTIAGIGMGICFLLLGSGVGNLIEILHRCIPISVISGLQLGVGWKLALKGVHMIQDLPSWWFSSTNLDCKSLAVACSVLCMYGLSRHRKPRRTPQQQATVEEPSTTATLSSTEDREEQPNSLAGIALSDEIDERGTDYLSSKFCRRLVDNPPIGIYLFMIGIAAAIVQLLVNPKTNDDDESMLTMKEPLIVNALNNTTATDWKEGILSGTLTQLPLTTLNSCLSVCLLAHTLFPTTKIRERVSRRSVCLSIGIINTVLCPLGMMPTCHGAGGLAGQHRLGANTGISMMVLGIFKIGMGLLASHGNLLMILDAIPVSVLGVLLVLAGHELAATGVLNNARKFSSPLSPSIHDAENTNQSGSCQSKEDDMAVCLITALVIVGTGHTHIGALSGWVACLFYGGLSLPCHRPTNPARDDTRYTPVGREIS